jgi:hypothetical protein
LVVRGFRIVAFAYQHNIVFFAKLRNNLGLTKFSYFNLLTRVAGAWPDDYAFLTLRTAILPKSFVTLQTSRLSAAGKKCQRQNK